MTPAPPPARGSCAETGDLALRGLAGLVLLCVACNAARLLCASPRRRRTSARRESREGAGPCRRAEQIQSTCRCPSGPWGATWRRAQKGTRAGCGGDSEGLRQLCLEAQAGPDMGGSEHSSSWLGAVTVREESGARSTAPSRCRSVSPGGRLPPARPARVLLCSPRPGPRPDGGHPAPVSEDSEAAVGQVVYDARWMRCVMGRPPGRHWTAAPSDGGGCSQAGRRK